MVSSQQGSYCTASSPSTDTAVLEIPSAVLDGEKIAFDLEEGQAQINHEDQQNSQDTLDIAWGKRGKIYMWIGYVHIQRREIMSVN